MKRSDLLLGFAGFLLLCLAACSTVKSLTNGDKKGFTGTWTLNNISFDGIPANTKFKATLFDDVAHTCLFNSTWNLPGNGQGSYVVNDAAGECNAGTRFILWSIQIDNGIQYLQFKHVDGGVKPKTVTAGYRMEVSSISTNAMTLRSPLNFEGKTVYVLYNFSK